MHDELARQRSHEHEDEPVAEEPVRHAQTDPRHPQHLERPGVARTVVKRRREPAVVVELLGLELVHREHHRQAAAPEREQHADERHITEDPGLVLDEHDFGLLGDVLHLLVEVRGIEVPHTDERHLVAALAKPFGDGERVVMDAAALIAGQHDDAPRAGRRKLPAALRQCELETTRDRVA